MPIPHTGEITQTHPVAYITRTTAEITVPDDKCFGEQTLKLDQTVPEMAALHALLPNAVIPNALARTFTNIMRVDYDGQGHTQVENEACQCTSTIQIEQVGDRAVILVHDPLSILHLKMEDAPGDGTIHTIANAMATAVEGTLLGGVNTPESIALEDARQKFIAIAHDVQEHGNILRYNQRHAIVLAFQHVTEVALRDPALTVQQKDALSKQSNIRY